MVKSRLKKSAPECPFECGGGGGKCYLGNAHMGVVTSWKGLPLSWRGLGKIHCFQFKHVLKKIYFFYWNTIWKRTIKDELFPSFSSILYSLLIWNISPQVISLKPTLATGKNCYQFKLLYGLFVVAIVTGFFSVLGWSLFTLSAHPSFLLL